MNIHSGTSHTVKRCAAFRVLTWLGIVLVIAVGAVSVHADSTDFDRLDPVPWAQRALQMEDVDLLPALFSVGGWTQIEKSPVVLARDGGAVAAQIGVRSRWQLRLMGAVNVLGRAEFALELPVSLLSRQRFNDRIENRILLNDLSLRGKAPIHVWTFGEQRLAIGVAGSLRLPTGDAGAFQGSTGRFAQPTLKLLGQFERRRLTARLMLGWAERDRTVRPEWRFEMDDQLLYRVGAAVDVRTGRTAIFELAGSTLARQVFSNVQHDALEFLGGAQLDLPRRVSLLPAAGIGLSKAYGVPAFRLMLSAFWRSPKPAWRQRLRVAVLDRDRHTPVDGAHAIVTTDGVTETVSLPHGTGRWRGAPVDRLDVQVAADGYLSAATTVVTGGRALNRVQVQLRRRPPGAQLVVGIETADGVTSVADVVVKGRVQDEVWTLTRRISVPGVAAFDGYAGQVSVTVRAAGYRSWAKRAQLPAGSVVELPVRLERLPNTGAGDRDDADRFARLVVEIADAETGMPVSDVTVSVPDAGIRDVVAGGHWRVVLPAGTWRLSFERDGYYPLRVSQTLEPGQRAFEALAMTPKSEELVVVGQKQIYINEKIYFATGSSKILPQSYGLLDALAKVLNDNPQVRLVRIAGHTDSTGRYESNMKLSEARARAVYEALVARGVDPRRLLHVGYGPNVPIADNATPEGRALNRRVELEILEQTPLNVTAVVPADQPVTRAAPATVETLDLPDVSPVLHPRVPSTRPEATEAVAPASASQTTAGPTAVSEAVAPQGSDNVQKKVEPGTGTPPPSAEAPVAPAEAASGGEGAAVMPLGEPAAVASPEPEGGTPLPAEAEGGWSGPRAAAGIVTPVPDVEAPSVVGGAVGAGLAGALVPDREASTTDGELEHVAGGGEAPVQPVAVSPGTATTSVTAATAPVAAQTGTPEVERQTPETAIGVPTVPEGRALRRALRRQRRAGQVQGDRWRGRPVLALRIEVVDEDDRGVPEATVVTNPDRTSAGALRRRTDDGGAVEVLVPQGPVTVTVMMPGYLPAVTRMTLTVSSRLRIRLSPLRAATGPLPGVEGRPQIRRKQTSGTVRVHLQDASSASPLTEGAVYVAGVTQVSVTPGGAAEMELPLGSYRMVGLASGYAPAVTTVLVGAPGAHDAVIALERLPDGNDVVVRGRQVLFGQPVRFRTGSAEIDPSSELLLDHIADELQAIPDALRIVISGHADDRGREETNLELSRRRAQAVADALSARGVASERIQVEAYGSRQPLVPSSDPQSRALNRRVEIVLQAPAAEEQGEQLVIDPALLESEFAEPATEAPQEASGAASAASAPAELQDLLEDLRSSLR